MFNIQKLVPCRTDGRLLLSGFQAVMTLTVTLYWVIWHTFTHQSWTSIYAVLVSDIAIFVLKRDVKLQLTNSTLCLKNVPPLQLAIIFTYTVWLRKFLAQMLRRM